MMSWTCSYDKVFVYEKLTPISKRTGMVADCPTMSLIRVKELRNTFVYENISSVQGSRGELFLLPRRNASTAV